MLLGQYKPHSVSGVTHASPRFQNIRFDSESSTASECISQYQSTWHRSEQQANLTRLQQNSHVLSNWNIWNTM